MDPLDPLEPVRQRSRPSDTEEARRVDTEPAGEWLLSEESAEEPAPVEWWEPYDPGLSPVQLQVADQSWTLSRYQIRRIGERLHSCFLDRALLRRR